MHKTIYLLFQVVRNILLHYIDHKFLDFNLVFSNSKRYTSTRLRNHIFIKNKKIKKQVHRPPIKPRTPESRTTSFIPFPPPAYYTNEEIHPTTIHSTFTPKPKAIITTNTRAPPQKTQPRRPLPQLALARSCVGENERKPPGRKLVCAHAIA